MKNKILTAISTIMLFVPWTILPLRTFDWALESPVAEIMISCYAASIVLYGNVNTAFLQDHMEGYFSTRK